MSPQLTVLADDLVEPVAPGWQLITATLVAIALLVFLITVVKLNPFLALIHRRAHRRGHRGREPHRSSSPRSPPGSAPPPPASGS